MDVLHLGRRDPRDAGQRNPERDQVDKIFEGVELNLQV